LKRKQKLKLIVREALNKKAYDEVILDIKKLTTIADYFVIITVDSGRQAQAVTDHIVAELKCKDVMPLCIEDTADTWMVIDYGDIIVHIFQKREREYYNLERLWIEADRVPGSSLLVAGYKSI